MSAHPTENSPWPEQTQAPPSSRPKRSTKRRRVHDYAHEGRSNSSKFVRQTPDSTTVEDAKTSCEFNSSNAVISCFPTASSSFDQHDWVTFVWNSNLPDFTQTDRVDIYLFHGDSLTQILHYPNQINPSGRAGFITAQVNDSWWANGEAWDGTDLTFPYYWLISRSDRALDGSQIPQSTFHAVQTTFADSVIASMASTSAAAAASASSASLASVSASLAAAASASAASASASASAHTASVSASRSQSASTTSATDGSGSVQTASGNSAFPHWAIAVIVVLGFLAIVAMCILAFLILRRIRRRNQYDSNRNSMGSASPMMANTGNSPQSPLLASGAAAAVLAGGAAAATGDRSSVGHGQRAPSVISPDGASTISRANSAGDTGPFSGADAAIMADAFRKALRKPDFRPVDEGESPGSTDTPHAKEDAIISQELAEEGRDIRSVSSSRGVRVETLSDSGDTVQDHSLH